MHKRYLMAPGPTPVPEAARLSMARELIHHRGPEFTEVFREVAEQLQWVFETSGPVLTLTCSGTGAFEAGMVNFTRRGDTIISVGGGKFGERWGAIGRAMRMKVVEIDVPWGEHLEPSRLKEVLTSHPETSMVTLTANETSTGVFHPVQELAGVVHDHSEALFAVDGITAVGVHEMPMDEWGIDLLVAGSQKAFGVPPGLGFLAASDRAWSVIEESDHGRYYFDLRRERKKQLAGQTAFTPAISVVLAMQQVLQMMLREGREALLRRHEVNALATRAAVEALGLELLASRPSNAVTAARVPEGISAPEVVRRMREQQGVTIAGGQGELKEHLIRLGHIGFFEAADIRVAIGALEMVLTQLGMTFEPGAGLVAAQQVFTESQTSMDVGE